MLLYTLSIFLCYSIRATDAHVRKRRATQVIPNISKGKPTKQSSNLSDRWGLSKVAVDGNTVGKSGSLTHTKIEDSPWWEVDLEDIFSISSVNIYITLTLTHQRLLKDFNLVITNSGRETWKYSHPGIPQVVTRISVPANVMGDKVKVQLPSRGFLSLAEVEVFGEIPSSRPLSLPSASPSSELSSAPSTSPSSIPSTVPSGSPSNGPSSVPSTELYHVPGIGSLPRINRDGKLMVYVHQKTSTNLSNHRRLAINCGGHLASVLNKKEQQQIYDMNINVPVIIGLTQPHKCNYEPHGCWKWDDGSKSSYTNWHAGEPNNLKPWWRREGEDCTEDNWRSSKKWNDFNCHRHRQAIYLLPSDFTKNKACNLQSLK